VIFYDGFNDSIFAYFYGAGRFQSDTSSKLQDLIEQDYPRLIIYSFSEWMANHSVFWRNYMRERIDVKLHAGRAPDHSPENLERAVRAYTTNVRMTKGICQSFGIRCLFVLQPLILTKIPLTAVESRVINTLEHPKVRFGRDFYQQAAATLRHEPAFHDLSHVLDGIQDSHFFDYGHTSPFAGIIIGKAIAAYVIEARTMPLKHS
jgi:hypothetical protein